MGGATPLEAVGVVFQIISYTRKINKAGSGRNKAGSGTKNLGSSSLAVLIMISHAKILYSG